MCRNEQRPLRALGRLLERRLHLSFVDLKFLKGDN
jgi:hypothetical protein